MKVRHKFRFVLACSLIRVEFLRGDSTTDECEPLFKQYKACLTVKRTSILFSVTGINIFQKALKDKGIDTMLDDARNDLKDADAIHLKRN